MPLWTLNLENGDSDMIDANMQAILQNTHAVKLVENMTEADWPPTGSVTLPDGTVITYTKTVQAPSP